jgi:GT2 family glycosyltransferase
MTRAGYQLAYAPRAEIWHKGGGSVVHRSAMHDYYAVRGTLMLMHRHFRRMMPFVLAHAVLRFLVPKLVRGQWGRFAAAMRGYSDFLRHAAGRPVPLTIR